MDDPTAEPDLQYTYVDELPACDIHQTNLGVVVEAAYDGKTQDGPWANMCVPCFTRFGSGLGTGKGQRLFLGKRPPEAGTVE